MRTRLMSGETLEWKNEDHEMQLFLRDDWSGNPIFILMFNGKCITSKKTFSGIMNHVVAMCDKYNLNMID